LHFFSSLKDLEEAENDGAIIQSEEMFLSDFRLHLTECWERLQVDVDCIYIVSYAELLPLLPSSGELSSNSISEVAHKLLAIDSGLIEVENLLKEK